MKLLVDEMPYYKDDCLFSEQEWSDEKVIWVSYCKLTSERCDLGEEQCSCLKVLIDRKTEQTDWKDQMWAEAVEDEPQTYGKGLQLFTDILFDKEKSEQFLKECKALGIEPQTERSE